jgi:glycosyltransferase involved in cell wall biosynthesis
MRRADWIIAVAEAVRRETIDLFGVDASRIITIPNGVSQQRLRPIRGREVTRRLLDIPRDAVVVLSLGALSWEKDPMAQLMVASSVVNKHDEVVHVFVGDGPLRHSLEDRIHELGLSSRCRVLGARADVGDIFGASDVFLFASREDGMEGMPATVIEAGMAELPVASYSVMGIPEVVHHGETGLLARYGDLLQLTEHVGRLVRSQAMRRTMGRAAGRFCRSHFEIGHIAARYLDLYSTWTSDARSLSIAGTDRL